jgi:hypothetical protein
MEESASLEGITTFDQRHEGKELIMMPLSGSGWLFQMQCRFLLLRPLHNSSFSPDF